MRLHPKVKEKFPFNKNDVVLAKYDNEVFYAKIVLINYKREYAKCLFDDDSREDIPFHNIFDGMLEFLLVTTPAILLEMHDSKLSRIRQHITLASKACVKKRVRKFMKPFYLSCVKKHSEQGGLFHETQKKIRIHQFPEFLRKAKIDPNLPIRH